MIISSLIAVSLYSPKPTRDLDALSPMPALHAEISTHLQYYGPFRADTMTVSTTVPTMSDNILSTVPHAAMTCLAIYRG
jgi:hypothetical protein